MCLIVTIAEQSYVVTLWNLQTHLATLEFVWYTVCWLVLTKLSNSKRRNMYGVCLPTYTNRTNFSYLLLSLSIYHQNVKQREY